MERCPVLTMAGFAGIHDRHGDPDHDRQHQVEDVSRLHVLRKRTQTPYHDLPKDDKS